MFIEKDTDNIIACLTFGGRWERPREDGSIPFTVYGEECSGFDSYGRKTPRFAQFIEEIEALGICFTHRSVFSVKGDLRNAADIERVAIVARHPRIALEENVVEFLKEFGHDEFDPTFTYQQFRHIDNCVTMLRRRPDDWSKTTLRVLEQTRDATEDQIVAGYEACRILADFDEDYAIEANRRGFGKSHTIWGHFIGRMPLFLRSQLSDAWAVALSKHYRKQMSKELRARIEGTVAEAAA
ncbi:hypothetical protein SAMN06297251_10472 [Fulvimarina manganoxydans]|uniref:Uncharacterized protein n=1 Tax=Fulvimarina manganoxydans TaxID=937218 RepID=A0A1W2ACA9_9HYPH|nr:hypothetical protein [Fulvimarina manganoxydans]SMC58359.1 hypothetical protein SAMN06297251_10472 [Fulvimarina manganoxydans]